MESPPNPKLFSLNISYDSFDFYLLSLVPILFLVLAHPLLIPNKDKKSSNNIKSISFISLSWCAIQWYLGIAKCNMTDVFMKIGSIVSVMYNNATMLVISNDFELIKNMQNSPDEWIGRPKNALLQFRAEGDQDRGILTSSGEVWKETRRYTVRTLTQLGLGKKNSLVYTTNEELKDLLENAEDLIQKTNNNVPIRNFFSLPAINVVWRIIGGTRFSKTDPEFIEIVEASDIVVEASFFQLIFGDFLGIVLDNVPRLFGKIFYAQCVIKSHFTNMLQKHQKVLKATNDADEDENFTDNFLRQINLNNNGGKDGKDMSHVFNIENLGVTLYDLFDAGVDTTSSTLEFALMHLVDHPHVQERIQREIKNVIGDKEPSFYDDRADMPYTQAVIYEVHRMASIVPLNFRAAAKDCYINDIFIRKGTAAVLNLYSIHYNEKFWGDPQTFRPERFITEECSLDSSKLKHVLNFGAGKRVCIGETVATLSVFTFLVGVLQKYKLEKAFPEEELGMELKSSFTSRAKAFHARFIPV